MCVILRQCEKDAYLKLKQNTSSRGTKKMKSELYVAARTHQVKR